MSIGKAKIKKEHQGFMTPHGGKSPPDQKRETYANLLKDTIKVQAIGFKKDKKRSKIRSK